MDEFKIAILVEELGELNDTEAGEALEKTLDYLGDK